MGGGDLTINFINEMSATASYSRFSATELTGKYNGDHFSLSYSTRPLKMGKRVSGSALFNSGTFYNFDRKYVGNQRGISVSGEGQVLYNLITHLQGEFVRTYDPENVRDGDYFKISSNSTFMFTKDLFIRLHAQGMFGTTYYGKKEVFNDYLLSCLFSWEYRPGSFLYLAYNEGRFDESNPTAARYFQFSDRTIILKLSYFFNI
jgi:hypothetical protein